MKKDILIFDSLNTAKDLYKYIEQNYKNINIKYIEMKKPNSLYEKLKNNIEIVFKVGILRFIRYIYTKNTVVVVCGNVHKYKLISKDIVSLNHGWATKKSPGKNEINNKKIINQYQKFVNTKPTLICLSEFDETYYLKDKNIKNTDECKFIPLGMSRNDYLVENKNNKKLKDDLRKKLNISNDTKIFLYAPTHREFDDKNINLYNKLIDEFKIIDKELEDKNSIILFRPHYYCSNIKHEISKFKNILYVGFENYSDVRDLMIGADILITDYSSIFVDYLLLDKPIVFYNFDYNEYEEYRGLVIDFKNKLQTPGPKIKQLRDIIDIDEVEYSKYNIEESKMFYHKYYDGYSTQRIAKYIVNL